MDDDDDDNDEDKDYDNDDDNDNDKDDDNDVTPLQGRVVGGGAAAGQRGDWGRDRAAPQPGLLGLLQPSLL